MDPGSYIAIAEIALRSACFAVRSFRNALNYSSDSERLVLNLEIERFRLHIWGENSGLFPDPEEKPSLPERLLPISDVLSRHLDEIKHLVQDADALRDRYGLVETQSPPTTSAKVRDLVDRMQKCIRSHSLDDLPSSDAQAEEDDATLVNLSLDEKRRTSTWKRLRWAVRDVKKFDGFVTELSERITRLNRLLTESQQRKTQEDNERVNIILVNSVVDKDSLDLLLSAVKSAPATSQRRSKAEFKAVSADLPWSQPIGYMSISQPRLSEFILPEGYGTMKRFMTSKPDSRDSIYLLERKDFDPHISPIDKKSLMERIQRLVLLLQKPKSPGFKTPQAQGCIEDASQFCWWMVFRASTEMPQPISTPLKAEPLSLLSLLQPELKFRPPLELRYHLASNLCTTLSELYSSSWLHKGIRSENILFSTPLAPSASPTLAEMNRTLQSMALCGFDYSRQESEQSTIDRSRAGGDVAVAIYRHPSYQGDAARGYKIGYDIYSLGLVLVEIALWVPLSSFLDARASSRSKKAAAADADVKLSGDMDHFFEPHAAALKRRVISRVDSEFPFRMGSTYYKVVKFCLEFADNDKVGHVDGFPVHPALIFYNEVVAPLSRLANSLP